MKQSNNKKYREETAAVYVRLSRDDNLDGESYSISNQKKLLLKAAKEKGYSKHIVYSDDGISGVTMERPGFQQMIKDIENGCLSAVFVKDMSRLGRNYLKVGYYTEEFFPEHDIRLVAVSDGVDTDEGDNEFTPFRNIMNEWYARDISKKCRIVNKLKGSSGEPLGQPPYGYQKDLENPKHWLIDEEAAAVVRNIYDMNLSGLGVEQIAVYLDENGILTPINYWKNKGMNRGGLKTAPTPTHWNKSTVRKILSLQEYCGDIINFKTYSKSYKNKKRLANSEKNMAVFRDVNVPVINRAAWEKVQEKRGKTRKRVTNTGEKNMFSGLLVCADCGGNMNFHFNQTNREIRYFNCSNNNRTRKTCPTTHYIRVDFLEEVVLQGIRRLTKFASRYESQFAELIMGHSQNVSKIDRSIRQKELDAHIARDRELDRLFEFMYEDNKAGKISDERFLKMTSNYEREQNELAIKIKALRAELEKSADKAMTADMFISTVRKYTRAKKLNERMLNELIERIEVFHAEKIDGVKTQRLIIHYNCVGTLDIPDTLPLLQPEFTLNTRKGVEVSYSA